MPTASVFGYATECFRGLKLYHGEDGKLCLFRVRRSCERLRRSAARIALTFHRCMLCSLRMDYQARMVCYTASIVICVTFDYTLPTAFYTPTQEEFQWRL